MEFKISSSKKNGKNSKTVAIPKETIDRIIDLLSNVECTCVWSDVDNQYIKVNDIPDDIVPKLEMLEKLSYSI